MFIRYQQIVRLIDLIKPASIVEIGTWNGDHAIIMATAALKHRTNVHYLGFDLFEKATADTDADEFNVRSHHSLATVHAKLAAFEAEHPGFTFELVRGDTRETLPDTVADFAYIDGGHSIETVASDYAHLAACKAVVLDDYYEYDELGRRPDIETVGCNRLVTTIPHVILPAFDPLPSGGRIRLAATGSAIVDKLSTQPHTSRILGGPKRAVVTTFSTQGYYDYASRFMDTFDRFWPADVDLYCYVESSLPLPDSPRMHAVNMLTACPDLVAFKNRHSGNAKAHGEIDDGGQDYRFDAVKFCHKVFALTHAARTIDAATLYWVDADSVFFGTPDSTLLDDLLPNGAYTAYLGRRDMHSECGFMAFDLTHACNAAFMEFWASIYADDLVFQLPEWHDSYVYDVVRRYYESKGQIVSHDLRATATDDHHPFINSPLGGYIDHLIGPRRKQSGCSYALDIRTPRDEFYWKVVPWMAEELVPLAERLARERAADQGSD